MSFGDLSNENDEWLLTWGLDRRSTTVDFDELHSRMTIEQSDGRCKTSRRHRWRAVQHMYAFTDQLISIGKWRWMGVRRTPSEFDIDSAESDRDRKLLLLFEKIFFYEKPQWLTLNSRRWKEDWRQSWWHHQSNSDVHEKEKLFSSLSVVKTTDRS